MSIHGDERAVRHQGQPTRIRYIVLEAVICGDGLQVVRVSADDPRSSRRVMLAVDTAVNVQHRERCCISQRRRFDRRDSSPTSLEVVLEASLDFLALKRNSPEEWFENFLCYNVSG